MKALSLFSGIGGIDLAAEWAGIETIAFCEYADFPRKVLKKHWPEVPIFKDVKKLNIELLEREGIDVGTIELIHGGFPCQPYSVAGKRKGTEDDRDLWPEMFRIIKEIRPHWVVGENVANFAKMELDRTLSNLESIGYEATTFVLPALAVGAPHKRLRTFIVAYSNSKRWGSMEKSKKRRCTRVSKESFGMETWKRLWDEQNDLLLTSTREITNRGIRIQRNDDGLSEGMDRLKALGNAVVPQQVYPIFRTIMEIEEVR